MTDDPKALVRRGPTSLAPVSRLAERTLAARAAREAGESTALGLVASSGRTLVVSKDEPGAYRTIAGAVAAAQDGDRVIIRPGTYQESVTVERAIEILGDGDGDTVVVEGKGVPCFVLEGDVGRIGKLTVRGGGPIPDDSYLFDFKAGIFVQGGSPVLEDLILDASLGIVVRGVTSPSIRHCVLLNGPENTILVNGGASCTIEDNEIHGHAHNAIDVNVVEYLWPDAPALFIRRNSVHDGQGGGISVSNGSAGMIEENEIYATGYVGIALSNPSEAFVARRNRVHHGLGAGIAVNWGAGTIEDNEIYANAGPGIQIQQIGTNLVRRNIVRDGADDGIVVQGRQRGRRKSEPSWDGVRPRLELNRVTGNVGRGIHVLGRGAQPSVQGNTITGSLDDGIRVADGAGGDFRNNTITGNAGMAIRVDDGTSATFVDNETD